MGDIEREQRITAEMKKMRRILKRIPKDRQELARKLIEREAFLLVALEDLEAQISANGYVSEYQNGENQWGTKKSPEVEIYNTAIKNYNALIKQLADMVPVENGGRSVIEDGFEQFVETRLQ